MEIWLQYIITPLLGGLLAAASYIIARKPDAKEAFDKVAPFQAAIGVAVLGVGIFNCFDFLPHFSMMMKFAPMLAIGMLATTVAEIVVGFLLGFGLIAKWIPGEGQAETKAVEMQKKLMTWQVPIGLFTIGCAVFMLIMRFKYS